ncbi:MAG: hypothetical protein JWQ45_2943 [Blastococcus sp.]|nr:hypothetical protein [Blastococcus sp.]
MTTPDGHWSRLTAVAAWDVSPVHGAVSVLVDVAARLPLWRMRLGTLARSLEDPRCWSGPAAQSAAGAVLELSTVAAAVDAAMEESLEGFQRLSGQARLAQELAAAALHARPPDGLGVALAWHSRLPGIVHQFAPGTTVPGPDTCLDPGSALAVAALEHAASASAAAGAAGEAVTRLGRIAAGSVGAFGQLAAEVELVGPVFPPPVPASSDPARAAAWWAGLSVAAQLAAVRSAPAAVGALDGLPAWARDRANRLLLAHALRDPGAPPSAALTARRLSRRIAAEEARGQQVQLQLLDLGGDRVVLALGDLDTADAVALLVPGVGNRPEDDLDRLTDDAVDVTAASQAAAPGLAVATVVWLGYRTPGLIGMVSRAAAASGGAALASGLAGLLATRSAAGGPQPRTTVLAHSYGTVVVDEAADVRGRLSADAVVLLGSPGMEGDARSLEAPEIFDAAAPSDPVAGSGYYGSTTDGEMFGATELPVDFWMGHSDYYDTDRPTLAAIGEVVAGVRRAN